MGTIVAVKRGERGCIAANCFCTRDVLVKASLTTGHDCIFTIGESLVAFHATLAFQQAFETLVVQHQHTIPIDLTTRNGVYTFFNTVHAHLKNQAFMNVQYQNQQDFEWLPMTALVLNKKGLFKVDSARGVFQLQGYWSIGTGESFALGALQVSYDLGEEIEVVARRGVAAANEFSPVEGGACRVIPLPEFPAVQGNDSTHEGSKRGRKVPRAKKKESFEHLN